MLPGNKVRQDGQNKISAAGFGAVGILLLLLVLAVSFWAVGLYMLREDVRRAVQQLKNTASVPQQTNTVPFPLARTQFAFLGEAKEQENAIRRNVVAPYLDYQHRRNREILGMVFQAEPTDGGKKLRVAVLWREGEEVGGEIFSLPFLKGDKLELPLWAPPAAEQEEEESAASD